MRERPKILMLGWEYPPNISGGLAVACEGLTKALSESTGADIHFVLPRLLGGESAPHMRLSDSFSNTVTYTSTNQPEISHTGVHGLSHQTATAALAGEASHGEQPSLSAYAGYAPGESPIGGQEVHNYWLSHMELYFNAKSEELVELSADDDRTSISKKAHYGANVFEEVSRFTRRVLKRYADTDCDIIHAHDWMTYAAGVALSRLTGKPLVIHVHSLDYDRSGSGRNEVIYNIEKMGLEQATAVIAVSHYTKSIIEKVYGIDSSRISVAHNGIYSKSAVRFYRKKKKAEKSVLFLGRVTLQKGPDYFIRAAALVLSQIPDVNFIMAGTGDMLPSVVELAHELGIGEKVHFAGFLSGKEIEEAFSQADLYVMPSVSEPFGISALEAIHFDTPVIMSKQSGAGEVVQHSLKFDFWDVERFADLMINGLLHEELREDMVAMAKKELQKIRWEAAAERTMEVYQQLL